MTRFHFAGRYNDDPNSLITHEHEPGYVPFKEAQTMNKLAVVMNGIAIIITFIVLALYYFLAKAPLNILGLIASIIVLVPHEFLHAICFEGDVYMYENLRKGMLFVVGPGTFSKAGFIFMSMLPNIVFGFIPLTWSHVYNGACRGAGNVKAPTIIAISTQCLFKYLFVVIGLKYIFDIRIIYLSSLLSFCLAGICATLYFHFSPWTKDKGLRL